MGNGQLQWGIMNLYPNKQTIVNTYRYKFLSWLFPEIVWTKDTESPNIFLSFDDGPHPKFTPQILDILKTYNSKATFFPIGEKVQRHPEIISRIFEEGHTIGIHSQTHHRLIFKSRARLIHELLEPQKIIKEIIDWKPSLFRPPYGYFSPRLLKICRQLKITVIMWTVMSYDFNPKTSAEQIIDKIIRQLSNGTIIVFHDGHTNSHRTVKILPPIIEELLGARKSLTHL